MNIAYYKYPLRDAIKNSFNLLYKSKAYASNSISMSITKHSGQIFNTTFTLSTDIYKKYKTIVDEILKEKISLPHSFHHSLKRYETAILSTFESKRNIDPLFKTIFNDLKKESDEEGIEKIKEYINLIKPNKSKQFDEDVFSALSIIKFLREDRKDKNK